MSKRCKYMETYCQVIVNLLSSKRKSFKNNPIKIATIKNRADNAAKQIRKKMESLKKREIEELVRLSSVSGFRVKRMVLFLLEEEIVDLYKKRLPITYIRHYLFEKYGLKISRQYLYVFLRELAKDNKITFRKNSKPSSNFQRLPSQNEYNSTVSEEEAVSDTSPYEEGSYSHKQPESTNDAVENARATVIEAETPETTLSEPPSSDTKQTGEYEIAPIGIEKRYSLEEIFPREKWRFDVYNLPLKEGLEKEIEDMYIIDAFECAKEFLKIAHGGREFRNEKTDFLWRLLWRVMKLGYKLDNMEMKYDKEAENVYEAIGYEIRRLRKEADKDKPLKLSKPECDTSDFAAARRKYKERKLKRIMEYINNKKEKK